MPNFSHSNIDDIYLLALFKNQDLKHGLEYNLIVENNVKELKVLETDGILINGNINIYGTLVVSLAFDNLGGNQLLGFSGSFNAHYSCRFCEMLKEITKKVTEEEPILMRTIEDYRNLIVDESRSIDLVATKGVNF
jgi:hypothetical protein